MTLPAQEVPASFAARMPGVLMALVPGALTVYFAFEAGGYFVGPTAIAAIVLVLLLVVRVFLVSRPGVGFGASASLAAGALALFAAFTLASGAWSQAPARALVEFNRDLLYVLALATFASLGGQIWRLRWMVRGMAVAAVVVCGVGLASRLLPDLWPISPDLVGGRLRYPVTYENTLGLLAALGMILCLGITSSERESPVVHVLAAAALPILGTTLTLTLSRGSMAAGALGLVVFVLAGRPRTVWTALVAVVPSTALAMKRTFDADLLFSENPLTQVARDQGGHIALVVALCAVTAAGVRALLTPADSVLSQVRQRPSRRRWTFLGRAVVVVVIVIGGVTLWVDAGKWSDRLRVTPPTTAQAGGTAGARARLTQFGGLDGRVDLWRVAVDGFAEHPLRGRGAGTFALSWQQDRPGALGAMDAHSLYAEVLDELGLIGLALVGATLLVILRGVLRRALACGPDRTLFATLLAAGVAWAVAAGIDWHWEMPGVSFWLFALGGTALARQPPREDGRPILAFVPRLALVGALCAIMIVVPLRLQASQHRLERAVAELARDRCDRVVTLAESALNAVDARPQGYELLSRCALQSGDVPRAIDTITQAIRRDPDNWAPRYSLAVALARAGLDPREAARSALRRNPHEVLAIEAVKRFEEQTGARAWRLAANRMTVQVSPF